MPTLTRRLLIAPALLLLILLVYWRLALPGSQHVWFDQYDMCQLEIPRLQFLARSLHNGQFPQWNPRVWAGQPVLGAAQPGPIYPLNLAFLAVGGEELSIPQLNWLFIAMHFAGAGFFYLFCRDNKIGVAASLLGAVAFSCAGSLGEVPWLDMGNGLTWTPLILLFAMRLWSGRTEFTNAVWLGLALGVSWLTGHHEIPLINSYLVLLGTLAVSLFRLAQRRFDMRPPALVGLALLLGAALSAIQTIPMWEFGQQAKRWVGAPEPIGWNVPVPYTVHAQYSMQWRDLANLVIADTDPALFVGFGVSLLAVFGLFQGRSQRWIRSVGFVCLAGWVYSLGANTPVHRLLYEALPMLDKARTPVRGAFLITFAVSAFAAYGAHLIIEHRARWRIAAAAILMALVLIEITAVSSHRMTRINSAGAVCASELFAHRDIAQQLHHEPNVGRITVNSSELMTSFGELYGFDQLQSFVAGVPANILRHGLHTARTGQLFGVSHHIGKTPRIPGSTTVGTYSGGLRLFRERGALPRAWIAHEVMTVPNEGELRKAVDNSSLDLHTTAVILGATPALESCGGEDTVQLRHPTTDTVTLRANLRCRGLVIVSDTFYPGWQATVDGKPATIHEVYGAFRGVVAEAGEHTIEMRYRPFSVLLGAVVSAAALLVASALLLWRR